MKLNIRYLLATTLAFAIVPLVQAQDMSGWSDKTICRLINTQENIQPYMQEATNRDLECIDTNSRKISKPDTYRTTHKKINYSAVLKSLDEDNDGLFEVEEINLLTAPDAKAPLTVIKDSVVGNSSLAFQLNDGECGEDKGKWSDCDNNRERTELNFQKEQSKQEKWYRFYVKFPESHNNLAPANLSVIQWKRYSKPSQTMIQFQQTAAGLVLNRNGQTYKDSNIVLVKENELYNRWIELVFSTNWHPEKDKGFMKLWVDGEMKFDHQGPSHAPTAEEFSMRMGLYSSFLHQFSALFPDKPFPTREIYIDGVRAESTCEKLLNDKEQCDSLNDQTVATYTVHKINKHSVKATQWDVYSIFAFDFD